MSAEPDGTTAAGAAPIPLRAGRTLSVRDDAGSDLVEVRGADGGIEVRILLTDKGPVLRLEAVRLSLKAADAVDVEAPRVRIQTTDALSLSSEGGIDIAGDAEVEVTAGGDVRVVGSMIYLN